MAGSDGAEIRVMVGGGKIRGYRKLPGAARWPELLVPEAERS